jgi:TIR domain
VKSNFLSSSEIFVSYASADRERVAKLVHALESEGLQVWWDRDIAYGQSFHKVIEQALAAATCVIVVWTRESVGSEWVQNEASDARKRDRLVPVLLDSVAPPLEFRHLQAADLSSWNGDPADPQFTGLRKAVTAMLGRGDAPRPATPAVVPARSWWQTRPGQALALGGLLVGLSVLLITLKQVGLIGSPTHPQDNPGVSRTQLPSGIAPVIRTTQPPQPQVAEQPARAITASIVEPLNLLDTEAGARLIAANEESWKGLFGGKPTSTIVSRNGFAVLAVRGDKAAKFDTLAIFVDYASVDNIKELAVYTSSASPEGPFAKVAQLTVPNYRNMEKPFHELHLTPSEARFVKLQVVSLQNDYGPNGLLGTIQLYASKH